MVILAAKSTDAHFEEAKRGYQMCGAGIVQVGSGNYVCAEVSSLLLLSLMVLSANLMRARPASKGKEDACLQGVDSPLVQIRSSSLICHPAY